MSKFEDCVRAQQKCAAYWGDRRISFLFNNAVSVNAPTNLTLLFSSYDVSVQMVNIEYTCMCLRVESRMKCDQRAHFTTRKSMQLVVYPCTHTQASLRRAILSQQLQQSNSNRICAQCNVARRIGMFNTPLVFCTPPTSFIHPPAQTIHPSTHTTHTGNYRAPGAESDRT